MEDTVIENIINKQRPEQCAMLTYTVSIFTATFACMDIHTGIYIYVQWNYTMCMYVCTLSDNADHQAMKSVLFNPVVII